MPSEAWSNREQYLKDNCPITDMHIIQSSQQNEKDFKYVTFVDNFKIGFSRVADGPPLTDF